MSVLIKLDNGEVNQRLLTRYQAQDFRRIERPGIRVAIKFSSAEAKRLYLRYFNALQVDWHYVSVVARYQYGLDAVEPTQKKILERIDRAVSLIHSITDQFQTLCQEAGITELASYDTQPLVIDGIILSSTARKFYDLLCHIDIWMPALQTLEIHDVLPAAQCEVYRQEIYQGMTRCARRIHGFVHLIRKELTQQNRFESSPPQSASAAPVDSVDNNESVLEGEQTTGEVMSMLIEQHRSLPFTTLEDQMPHTELIISVASDDKIIHKTDELPLEISDAA